MYRLSCVLIFGLFVMVACRTDQPDAPNVVYILADDMGYGDVSCLNPEAKLSTPNLDRLAAEGISFTDAHSGAAVCTPTRYGILTGRYCWRSELKRAVLWSWDGPLIEADRLTVGGFLKQHGYTTACIGKWHLGWDWPTHDGSSVNDSLGLGAFNKDIRARFGDKVDFSSEIGEGPVTRGFDYYFGDDVPNFPPYCFIENDRALGQPGTPKPDSMFGAPGPMMEDWRLEAVMPELTRRAVAYIKAESMNGKYRREREKPFFLYFPLTAPHTPIAPAEEFRGASESGAYGDFVQQVDWTVGQVMKALDEEGMADNTILIFTSDNGSPGRDGTDMGGKHNTVRKYGHNPSYIYRGIKADIWEGGHRVPFFARWKGHIEPGTTSEEVICHTDLMATLAAILHKPLPEDAGQDSYNMLPALIGEDYIEPIREATVHHSIKGEFSIRQGKWKLILCPGSGGWSQPKAKQALEMGLPEVQLYDMSIDPEEQHNVSGEHPDVAQNLQALLKKYQEEGRSKPL